MSFPCAVEYDIGSHIGVEAGFRAAPGIRKSSCSTTMNPAVAQFASTAFWTLGGNAEEQSEFRLHQNPLHSSRHEFRFGNTTGMQ